MKTRRMKARSVQEPTSAKIGMLTRSKTRQLQKKVSVCHVGKVRKRRNYSRRKDNMWKKSEPSTQLSSSLFFYPNRGISDHGNVFEGEIRSGAYGIRVCAVKFVGKSDQNIREAKILTKLSSRTHIVSFIESGICQNQFEERVYIAMDKCHKQNLQQHLISEKQSGVRFNVETALKYSKQIINGVTYIHENLIIHKDLKPSNILLSHDKSTVKIADFGLSQEIKSKSSKVFCEHQFGTNGFRPIESFGNNWASLKSDTFSLGVVLYFVLSNGESPYGDDDTVWIRNTKSEMMDFRHLLVPNSSTFQHLFELMLSQNRCVRPSVQKVGNHPCWSGKEVYCDFDYGYEEEQDDSDNRIQETIQGVPDYVKSEKESQLEFLKAVQRIGLGGSQSKREISIITFDQDSKLNRFKPRDESMTPVHEFNEEMKASTNFYTAISIGENIYVFMKMLVYRLQYGDVTSTWIRMADLIDNHGLKPPVLSTSKAIYAVGTGIGLCRNLMSKYDPRENRWQREKRKSLATSESTNICSNKLIYCIGGFLDGVSATERVERYDLNSKTWVEICPMREARRSASAVECYGKILVAGGMSHNAQILKTVEKYDPQANQWTTMKPMLICRSHFRCYLIEGNIYAIAGDIALKTFEKYSFEKNEWEVKDVQKPLVWESVYMNRKI